jgi:hypothetical protein
MRKAGVLFASITSFVFSSNAIAIPNKHPDVVGVPLTVYKKEAGGPFTVQIARPQQLADLLVAAQKSNQHSKWGDGFSIDWGDGSGDGDAARGKSTPAKGEAGTHTYASPGSYTIKATLYDFLPTDGHETYWTGSLTVTVGPAH